MKRSLRSRNSCLAISNIFEKQINSELSELIKLIPQQVLKKLPQKKQITCQDILNLKFEQKANPKQLQKIRLASKLLKQRIEGTGDQTEKVQHKAPGNNQSYFDCLLDEEEYSRKNKRPGHMAFEGQGNIKSKIQFKVQYKDETEHNPYVMNQSMYNFYGECVKISNGIEDVYQKTRKISGQQK